MHVGIQVYFVQKISKSVECKTAVWTGYCTMPASHGEMLSIPIPSQYFCKSADFFEDTASFKGRSHRSTDNRMISKCH